MRRRARLQQDDVHADFGGSEALRALRERLRTRGIRLILDFVPNHTAVDHAWVREHPDYYVPGSASDLAQKPSDYFEAETTRVSMVFVELVRKKGFEPSRPCGHKLLRLARLPVPPLPH